MKNFRNCKHNTEDNRIEGNNRHSTNDLCKTTDHMTQLHHQIKMFLLSFLINMNIFIWENDVNLWLGPVQQMLLNFI